MKMDRTIKSHIIRWSRILFVSVLLISGCDTALTVSGRTVGVSSGKFIFTDGSLYADYNSPFDKVWKACKKTITDMKASGIEEKKKISTGVINAVVQDEKVQIIVEYLSQEKTSVSVRTGMAGSIMASQLIHEKIANNLLKFAEQ